MTRPCPGVREIDVHERGSPAEADAALESALLVDPGVGVEDPVECLANLGAIAHRSLPFLGPLRAYGVRAKSRPPPRPANDPRSDGEKHSVQQRAPRRFRTLPERASEAPQPKSSAR